MDPALAGRSGLNASGSVDYGTAQIELPRDWSIDPTTVAANCRICHPEAEGDE
jgi:hypothetical protein